MKTKVANVGLKNKEVAAILKEVETFIYEASIPNAI